MIPNFAVIGIQTPEWHLPRLWVPLFLLWILLVVLSPLVFLVLAAAAIAVKTTIWRLIAVFWNLLSSLRGTDVQVVADGNRLLVKLL
jgi:hypothetical protein